MSTEINSLGVTFPNGQTQTTHGPWVHSTNGYEKVGNAIIQWGSVATTASSATVTFPTPFKTGSGGQVTVIVSSIAPSTDTGGLDVIDAYEMFSLTHLGFYVTHYTSSPGFNWVAMGLAP